MSKLVIVESPAKANTIQKYLGKGYDVVASKGHIRDLPAAKLSVDVKNSFAPKYALIKGKEKLVKELKEKVEASDAVYLAADPDREGEAISWHLATVLGLDLNKPNRVTFNEITKTGIANGMANPKKVNLDLVNAQQARRVLDRLIGYKISPLLWRKVKKGLSAGRVQSVATKMICDREEEIDIFVPEEYWTISAPFTIGKAKVSARFTGFGGDKAELHNQQEAQAVVDACRDATFRVSIIKKGERRKYPAAPFTTSNLQQEASRKLGFTTQKTMQIAQQLYEGVEIAGEGSQGLVTYIRTDSTRIADEALEAVRAMIADNYSAEYLPEKPNIYKTRSSAQDAHEAIRPTDILRRPDAIKASLSRDQFKLYKLIYERFVSSQMTPAVYDTLSVDIDASTGARFHFNAQKLRFAGFTAVYEESQDDAAEEASVNNLPELEEGMTAEDKAILAECMARLTDEERHIVVLHAVGGLRHRETAVLLGLPLSTVLSKYARALKKLKEHL